MNKMIKATELRKLSEDVIQERFAVELGMLEGRMMDAAKRGEFAITVSDEVCLTPAIVAYLDSCGYAVSQVGGSTGYNLIVIAW